MASNILYFHPYLGKCSNWTSAYFSDGLKPPTSVEWFLPQLDPPKRSSRTFFTFPTLGTSVKRRLSTLASDSKVQWLATLLGGGINLSMAGPEAWIDLDWWESGGDFFDIFVLPSIFVKHVTWSLDVEEHGTIITLTSTLRELQGCSTSTFDVVWSIFEVFLVGEFHGMNGG